jgi:FkbM family methyltransferase
MFDKIQSLRNKGYSPDTILDIGAYKGEWTEKCLKVYPSANYFLFEAIDYKELEKFQNNSIVQVHKNVILNDVAKEVDWHEMRNTGDSMFREKTHWYKNPTIVKRNSISLNDFAKQNNLFQDSKKIFLKIDCQGAEIPILKGATDILDRTDFILLEVPLFGQYNEGVPSFLEHIKYMDMIGFIPYDIAQENIINSFNVKINMIFISKKHRFNKIVQDVLLGKVIPHEPVNPDKRKHITIITYCSGYRFEVFRRFVGTLYDTGFSGNLIFVIKESDLDTLNKLMLTYKNVSYYIDDVDNDKHCQLKRYYIFQKMFETLSLQTDYVLLCDSRDLFFQRNIELYEVDPAIDLFFFEEGVNIGQSQWNIENMLVIENELKQDILSKVKDKKVICSGTTYGTKKGIKNYIDRMCYAMTHTIHGNTKWTGFDQGVHNYLIYIEGFDDINVKMLTNEDNLVNTLQNANCKFMNGDNQIVNIRKEPSYIVHQWDRLPKYMTERLCRYYDFSHGV